MKIRKLLCKLVSKSPHFPANLTCFPCLLSIRSGVRTPPESPSFSPTNSDSFIGFLPWFPAPFQIHHLAVFCAILRNTLSSIRRKFVDSGFSQIQFIGPGGPQIHGGRTRWPAMSNAYFVAKFVRFSGRGRGQDYATL